MKRRFSFLADQSGVVQIILGGLAVIAFVSLAIGLWGLGTAGQAANSAIIPAEKYADSKSNADPSKGAANNRAIWRSMRGQAIEVAADALNPDDTGLTGIADSCGAFDSPDKNKTPGQIKNIETKKQNDTKIGETLKKNNLPAGQLTKDVVKGIQKIVETNSKPSADDKTKENAVIAIIMQILQDISDNKAKVPVIDTVKQELDNQKILADEKIANTKKQLNRALSEKEYIEKEIAADKAEYDALVAQGYNPESNLNYLQERLDYANKEIAKLEGELAVLKSAEIEKQGQDSSSESTAADGTTAEDETTTKEDITTEEIADLPLTNEALAGTYSSTFTVFGKSIPGPTVISPSGSNGGTIEGLIGVGTAPTDYTLSGDTLTYSQYIPFREEHEAENVSTDYIGWRGTANIKFIKSGDTITGKGIMKGFYLGRGDEVQGDEITYEITMVKTG